MKILARQSTLDLYNCDGARLCKVGDIERTYWSTEPPLGFGLDVRKG